MSFDRNVEKQREYWNNQLSFLDESAYFCNLQQDKKDLIKSRIKKRSRRELVLGTTYARYHILFSAISLVMALSVGVLERSTGITVDSVMDQMNTQLPSKPFVLDLKYDDGIRQIKSGFYRMMRPQ
jgi:hypothetical protein